MRVMGKCAVSVRVLVPQRGREVMHGDPIHRTMRRGGGDGAAERDNNRGAPSGERVCACVRVCVS